MFLRSKIRNQDGKEHRYFSSVENRRVSSKRTVQSQVLYLGEINDSQQAGWCHAISAIDNHDGFLKQIAMFPEDRRAPPPGMRCGPYSFKWVGAQTSTTIGCMLACDDAVASTFSRRFLGRKINTESKGHTMAGCFENISLLSAHRSGK